MVWRGSVGRYEGDGLSDSMLKMRMMLRTATTMIETKVEKDVRRAEIEWSEQVPG